MALVLKCLHTFWLKLRSAFRDASFNCAIAFNILFSQLRLKHGFVFRDASFNRAIAFGTLGFVYKSICCFLNFG